MKNPELIVIGGGVAGAAAALRAAQYHIPTLWLLGDSTSAKGSRSAYVMNVDNMIGVHPWIMRGKVADSLRDAHPAAAAAVAQQHFHIATSDLVDNVHQRIDADFADWVTKVPEKATAVRSANGGFEVTTKSDTHAAPFVVLATGVMDRQPTVHKKKGDRDLAGIHWLFPYANHETLLYCIRCEGHLARGQRVAVVGGGVGTAEVALMVRERYDSDVTILTAGEPIEWDDRRARLLSLNEIEVVEGRLVDIRGGDKGSTLHGFTLESGRDIEVDLAFVVMGLHRVYNDLAIAVGAELESSSEPPERRHVLVDGNSQTTVENFFAVGDMTRHQDRPVMKQIYTAQEYAVRAVDTIDRRRRRARREKLLAASD